MGRPSRPRVRPRLPLTCLVSRADGAFLRQSSTAARSQTRSSTTRCASGMRSSRVRRRGRLGGSSRSASSRRLERSGRMRRSRRACGAFVRPACRILLALRSLPSQESQLTCFACARSQPEEGRGEPHCERSDRLLEVQGHAEGGTEDDQDQQRPCRQEDGVRKAVCPCACSS